jgi:hypothetical protein
MHLRWCCDWWWWLLTAWLSSLSSSFWVCATTADRDCCRDGCSGEGRLPMSCGRGHCLHHSCSCRGPFLPHYLHGGDDPNRYCCCCKGSRGKGHSPMPLWEREKGGVYSPTTAVVGGMTLTAVAAAARGVVGRGILWCHRGRGGKRGVYPSPTVVVGGITPTTITVVASGVVGRGILRRLFMLFWLSFLNVFHLISIIVSVCCCYVIFFWFLVYVYQCISFNSCPISAHCFYHRGKKRLVNSIAFFLRQW